MENYPTGVDINVTEYLMDRREKMTEAYWNVAYASYSCLNQHLDCVRHTVKSAEELMFYARENVAKFDERYDILLKNNVLFSDIDKVFKLVNYQMELLNDIITAKFGLYGMYEGISKIGEYPEDIPVPEKAATLQQIEEVATEIYELAQRVTTDILEVSESNSEQVNILTPAVNFTTDLYIVGIILTLLKNNMYSDVLWTKHKHLFATYITDKCDDNDGQSFIQLLLTDNICRKDEVLEIRKSYRGGDIDEDAAFSEYAEITFMYDARNLIEEYKDISPTKCASLLAEAYAYKSPSVSDAVAFCRKHLTADNGLLIRHELMERPEECREDIESVASEVIYERACLEYADCSSDLREYFKHHLDLEETDDCSTFADLEAKFYSDDM